MALAQQESGAAEAFEVVHAKILRFFPELVRELGGDPAALIAQAEIDVQHVPDGRAGATYRQLVHLIELAAEQLQCPDFGMRLATRQSGRVFGPLGLVMKNSRTFGEAVDYVSKHSPAHSLAARIWVRRSPADRTLFAGHDILLDRMPNKSQAMEQLLLLGHLGALEITGGHARARKVHFRHQPVSSLQTYRRYFGCEVCFGQNEDGVVFSERDLAAPIVEPDLSIYEMATSFIDTNFNQCRPPFHAQARGMIMRFLGAEDCSHERVAAELHLHPRTMNRRLKAEGTSFQRIKDEVRRDLMLYYLQHTDLDLSQVSERLGFAEQSVMTRTCNRWFSEPPTRLRSNARNSARSG